MLACTLTQALVLTCCLTSVFRQEHSGNCELSQTRQSTGFYYYYFFLIKSIHKKEIKKPKQTKAEEYRPRTNPKTRLLSACFMEISKLTVTNTLTHKNSGFTPEPSHIFFFLVYNTLLSVQAGPTVLICPEWLSKPVLRILSNVLKFLKYQPQEAIKQLL